MRRRDGGIGCGARAGETNAPPPPGRRRDPARRPLGAAREELADGNRLGRPGGLAARPPVEGNWRQETERHAKSLTESAARRRKENAAMARREAPHLRKKV